MPVRVTAFPFPHRHRHRLHRHRCTTAHCTTGGILCWHNLLAHLTLAASLQLLLRYHITSHRHLTSDLEVQVHVYPLVSV